MLKALRQINSTFLDENPWWQYRKDSYEMPDGSPGEYYYIHTPGSVMVIPISEDGNIIAVRQFRYLNRQEGIEFIGGGIKNGSSAEDSVRDELLEEAGIIAGELTRIGEFNPMNGVTDEICNIYVARSLKKTTATPEDSEEFEVTELAYKKFCELVEAGTIWDGMTLAAFALFDRHKKDFLPELE